MMPEGSVVFGIRRRYLESGMLILLKGTIILSSKFIKPITPGGRLFLETNAIVNQLKIEEKTDVVEMKNVYLPKMTGELIPFYMKNNTHILPFWVEIEKI